MWCKTVNNIIILKIKAELILSISNYLKTDTNEIYIFYDW